MRDFQRTNDQQDALHQPSQRKATRTEVKKNPEAPQGTIAHLPQAKVGGLGHPLPAFQGGLGQQPKKPNPQNGIQLKDTPHGKMRIYRVAQGNYPLQIVEEAQLCDIYELALLQHPTIVQRLGLHQRGYFDYNAVVSISRQDRDFEFWIQGFAKKWIVYPGDELLLEHLPGIPLPKEKVEEKKEEKPKGPKYRKADDWEEFVKRNASPDEADRIFDALGDKNRVDGLMQIFKKLGAKNKTDLVKIMYREKGQGHFPGGYLNPVHPVYTAGAKIDGKKVRIYDASKKYPGLFTTDGKQHYYAAETGPKYVTNGTWKKYVE